MAAVVQADDKALIPEVRLSIIVPCYNEHQVLPLFYEEVVRVLGALPAVDYCLIFVDDGSTDDTLKVLNDIAGMDFRVLVYSLSRNFGHQVALTAGLDVVERDAVILMDCDLQHPPALIPEMVQLWLKGNDVVSAVRNSTAGVSWIKRLTSCLFYGLINTLSDTSVVRGAADFCLLSDAARKALKLMPERHRFLRGMISWIGFRRAFVSFDAPPRRIGSSKYTTVKMIRLALDAVFSFSAVPIRTIGRFGAAAVLLGVLYFVYVVLRYSLKGDLVPGWASMVSVGLVLGGLQLIAIGVIGEYVARVFEEVKHRPLYFFKQTPRDW